MKCSIFVCLVVCLARLCDGLAITCLPGATDPSCTAERNEFNIPELNQSPGEAAEVQCLAGSEWESNCHRCRCSYQGQAECVKQSNDCDTGVLAEPALCKPNTRFQRDCNTCACLEGGLTLCTMIICVRSDVLSSGPEIRLATVQSETDNKDELFEKSPKTNFVTPDQNHYDIVKLVNLDHDIIIIKRSTICKPLQEFMRDCNPCKCASDGLSYSCTHNECLETEMDLDKDVEVFMQSEGQDHIERTAVCRASNTFYIGCNTCRCNSLGTDYSCTNKPCPLPADVELFDHENKITKSSKNTTKSCVNATKSSVDTTKSSKNATKSSGNTTKSSGNTIQSSGNTTKSSGNTTKSSGNTTKSQVCEAKRMFIKDCNTCWCNDDGTSYYCTRRVCVPLLPDDLPDIGGIPADNLRVVQKSCIPNEVFELDCNMCRCNPDGKSYACTRRACEDQLEDKKNVNLSRKVRALTTEPPKACQPGQEFRMDCNKCLCDNKGQDFSCTRIDCNALNNNHHASSLRSKRDTSEQVSMQCVPGSVFDRDCNVCRCNESGELATCTLKRCKDNKIVTEKAPESDQGFRCNPGEQFRRDCNDCTCSADGRSVFCTLRLCDQDLTSDI